MYVQSYHQAVARRLESITDNQLEISDVYSLLDWLHNMYNRYTIRSLTPCRHFLFVLGGIEQWFSVTFPKMGIFITEYIFGAWGMKRK